MGFAWSNNEKSTIGSVFDNSDHFPAKVTLEPPQSAPMSRLMIRESRVKRNKATARPPPS
jgi:hypothetical protein